MLHRSRLFKILIPCKKHGQLAVQALKWQGWTGIRVFVAVFAIWVAVQIGQDKMEQSNQAYELSQDQVSHSDYIVAIAKLGEVLRELKKAEERLATQRAKELSGSWVSRSRRVQPFEQTPASELARYGATASTLLVQLNARDEEDLRSVVSLPKRGNETLRNAMATGDSKIENNFCIGSARYPSEMSSPRQGLPAILRQITGRVGGVSKLP